MDVGFSLSSRTLNKFVMNNKELILLSENDFFIRKGLEMIAAVV